MTVTDAPAGQPGAERTRPTLAVWKFASCDGCQLTLLNCEDELIPLAGEVEIAYFPEATRAVVEGPYDVSLVEGSVTTPEEVERIQRVRAVSRRLITIGACATAGGIQALRNFGDVAEFRSIVYAHPEYLSTLSRSTPISAHVDVDFELRGCPINKHQLLEVLAASIQGRKPRIPSHSVCVECKRRGNVCVTVAHGTPCLGPVTQAGCGALCPSFSRGCYGCYGPQDTPNTVSIASRLSVLGMSEPEVMRVFRTFNAASEPFRRESERHEAADGAADASGPTRVEEAP
jgi:coenzyme F420-reducing hydrogenase gamma subunit